MEGQGGLSSFDANLGVILSGPGARITTTGGDIEVTGFGGGDALSTSALNAGVAVSGLVQAGGAGKVTLTGSGGVGTGGNQIGVRVDAAGQVSAFAGTVEVNGTGGSDGGSFNVGVLVNGGTVSNLDTGNIKITGTGGLSNSGGSNTGIQVQNNGFVTTGGGTLELDGTGGGSGSTGSNIGVAVLSGSQVVTGGPGRSRSPGRAAPRPGIRMSACLSRTLRHGLSRTGGRSP